MRNRLIIALLLFISMAGFAKDLYPRNTNIDVKHYLFQLEVNDSTDVLSGKATITILFKKSISQFDLDLFNQDAKGKGMKVSQVLVNQKPISFTQSEQWHSYYFRSSNSSRRRASHCSRLFWHSNQHLPKGCMGASHVKAKDW